MGRSSQADHSRKEKYRYTFNVDQHATDEQKIDRLIERDQFDSAREYLAKSLERHPDHYRLYIKLIGLPFYKLKHDLKDGVVQHEVLNEAECVHADAVELIQALIPSIDDDHTPRVKKKHIIGIISEVTILALMARHFNRTSESFPIPALEHEDMAGHGFGTDLHSIETRTGVARRMQIKTRRTEDHKFSSVLTTIGINDIDRFYQDYRNENSIYQLLIQEINGFASDNDIQHLNAIGDILHVSNHPRRTRQPRAKAV